MLTKSSGLRLLLPLCLFLLSRSLLGQGAPITGTASVALMPNPASATVDSTIQVGLSISLASVTGRAPDGSSTPAVLGGYQVTVNFDNSRLRLQSVSGGTSTGFISPPTSTSLTSANTSGSVSLAAAQTSPNSPIEVVSIVVLSFTAVAAGSANLQAIASSVSSAFQPGLPSVGPATIPATGSSTTVTIAAPAAPAAPTNVSPANNATDVSLPVSLVWNAAAGAAGYNVYFGTASDPPLLTSTAAASLPVTTLSGTRYFWRIAAINAVGSASGPTWSFTTVTQVVCAVPTAPQISAPARADSQQSYSVSWSSVPDATSYSLSESTDPALAGATKEQFPAITLTRPLKHAVAADTIFYYQVRGVNASTGCNVNGAASQTIAVSIRAPLRLVLSVAASTPGAFGSFFKTGVQLTNPGASAITGRLLMHRQGVSGTDADPTLTYSLAPGETRFFPDLLAAIGQSGLATVDLLTDSGPSPVAVIRLFNDAGEAGTTGFTQELLHPEDALKTGDQGVLVTPPDHTAFRFNVGVRTLDSGASIMITVRDASGAQLQTLTKSYPPVYLEQIELSAFLGSMPPPNSSLTISVTSGSAFLYGATADNKTQDPSLQIARRFTP